MIAKPFRKEGMLGVAYVKVVAATAQVVQLGDWPFMRSSMHASNRLHPSLLWLEGQFRNLLGRSFDPETLACLMRMEVETVFPGLLETDQSRIAAIVLEHMQAEELGFSEMDLVPTIDSFPLPGSRRSTA
ncbi:MAG: hypothetical protein M9924_08550 [Rhizobiaceae bacterium]|nr:hypothetical protein [Rhizobiaceae bacterium]